VRILSPSEVKANRLSVSGGKQAWLEGETGAALAAVAVIEVVGGGSVAGGTVGDGRLVAVA
jgi:hypothetical protein